MGTNWGSKPIVSSGLKHHYNPYNYRCYPGSGSTLTDLAPSGNNATLVATPTYTAPGFDLNGSTQYISSDGLEVARQSDTTGSIEIWFKITDSTPASNEYLWALGDTNANEVLAAYVTTSGTLEVTCIDAGTVQWTFDSDAAPFTDATWHQTVVTFDNTAAKMYVDGALEASTFTVTTDQTIWMDGLTGTDNTRIGCSNYNSAGNAGFLTGSVGMFSMYNAEITAANVSTNYESGKDLY